MENQALEIWARSAIENVVIESFKTESESENKICLNECILCLGKDIFSICDTENDLESKDSIITTIIENIIDHFGLCNLNAMTLKDDIHKQLKYCLIAAVSQSCEKQSSYIQNILGLASEYQTILMEIIKTGTDETAEISNRNDDDIELSMNSYQDEDITTEDINNNNNSEGNIKISNQNPSEQDDSVNKSKFANSDECHICFEKDLQIANHIKTIEIMSTRENDIENKFKADISISMNKLVDAEVLLIEKDQMISSLKDQMELSTKTVIELEDKLKTFKDNSTKVTSLQDQIDVLLPQTEKVQALEAQVTRLREKLDEQSNLKQQLKQESHAHSETHKILLAYETELEVNRKYKPLLDEYRSKHAESLIEIESLQTKLHQQCDRLSRYENDHINTVAGENNGILQAQILAEELHEANEKIRALERVQGVGEGISELNPALMNELNALRLQNQELLSRLDKSSLDSLDKLENLIEEQKLINSSLNAKWTSTTEDLKQARQNIEKLQFMLRQSSDRVIDLESCLLESDCMHFEDVESIKIHHYDFIQHMEINNNNKMLQLTDEKNEILQQLTVDLEQTEGVLNDCKQEIAQYKETKYNLEQDVLNLQEEIRVQYEKMNSFVVEYDTKMKEIMEKHETDLDNERENTRSMNADLDTEKSKRRRIEREKKLLEAELYRNKTQVQVAGTCTTQEVDAALKELKSMQIQLEEAHAELQVLKSSQSSNIDSQGESLQPVAMSGNQIETSCKEEQTFADDLTTSFIGTEGVRTSSRLKAAPKRNVNGVLKDVSGNFETTNLLQQNAEYSEKRIDQMQKEKREMIARNLEENKEKIELSQKLLLSEREIAALKTKLTKATLENERLERKIMKAQHCDKTTDLKTIDEMSRLLSTCVDKENIVN